MSKRAPSSQYVPTSFVVRITREAFEIAEKRAIRRKQAMMQTVSEIIVESKNKETK